MSTFQLLNNITHQNLKIITTTSAKYGDDVKGCIIFPEEFMAIQKEYPIFFQKVSQTGEFQAVAIFGFQANENLFLIEQDWRAHYIPVVMRREPFLIGFQKNHDVNEDIAPVIHIDIDHPRVSQTKEGEAVFLEHGGNSPYLDGISKALRLINDGLDISKDMFAAFLSLELVESFTLDIEFDDGEQYLADSYYTINQEKFFALDDASLGRLHKLGYLNYAYMVLASLENIKRLIELRNKKVK